MMLRIMTFLFSLDEFKKEIEDVFKDFKEIFMFLKRYTYDILAEKFGETGTAIMFWALGVALLMLILTAMIRH